MVDIGSIDLELPFIVNGENQILKVSSILTEVKLNSYLKELKKDYRDVFKFYELPNFEKTLAQMFEKNITYSVDVKKGEYLYKIIPYLKNKKFNKWEEKYKIGIITTNQLSVINDEKLYE